MIHHSTIINKRRLFIVVPRKKSITDVIAL